MAKRPTIDERLAEVRALEFEELSDDVRRKLERALADSSNLVVEAAASIVGDQVLLEFQPQLVNAYERFLVDPLDTDKGCHAKLALIEALNKLDFDDADFFLRGMKYTQREPVWDGSVDTAANLRGACAYGLVQSGQLSFVPIMTELVDLLNDECKLARVHAAQAIANTGRSEAIPVLRLKVWCGDAEFEVMGACFGGLLQLDVKKSVPIVAQHLNSPNIDIALEAAAALGESRDDDAIQALIDAWQQPHKRQLHEALLISMGLSNRPAANEFLLKLILENTADSEEAVRALAPNRFYGDLKIEVEQAVQSTNNQRLLAIFAEEFET